MKPKLPLIYSCSGASSAAQMANHIGVKLDRLKVAEMSCIAGVGGDVRPLVQTAKSGRAIIALDGCPLQCVKGCLAQHAIEPDTHLILSQYGLRKRYGEDCSPAQADALFRELSLLLQPRQLIASDCPQSQHA